MTEENTSLVPQDSKAEQNLQTMDTPTNYIPSIKITYAISEHFQQQKAKLGDFFYNNEQSLGNTIRATAIGYRYQVMAIDRETKDFLESMVLKESETPFRERKEYVDFCKQHVKDDIQDGVDILLFLPEFNLYGVLFCKKKLLNGGLQILKKAGNGNIVQIKTVKKDWKKLVWFILEVQGLGEKVETPDIESKLEIYNAQTVEEAQKDDTEGKGEERDR